MHCRRTTNRGDDMKQNYISDGCGGLLTIEGIVAIVNSRPHYNIKADDLVRLIETENASTADGESADYWRGKYDALKEIVEFTGDGV